MEFKLKTSEEAKKKLWEQREQNRLCDCFLRIGNRSMNAHSFVLINASEYFRKAFKRTGKKALFIFEKVSFEHLELIVKLAYFGSVTIKKTELRKFCKTLGFFEMTIIEPKMVAAYVKPRHSEHQLTSKAPAVRRQTTFADWRPTTPKEQRNAAKEDLYLIAISSNKAQSPSM